MAAAGEAGGREERWLNIFMADFEKTDCLQITVQALQEQLKTAKAENNKIQTEQQLEVKEMRSRSLCCLGPCNFRSAGASLFPVRPFSPSAPVPFCLRGPRVDLIRFFPLKVRRKHSGPNVVVFRADEGERGQTPAGNRQVTALITNR